MFYTSMQQEGPVQHEHEGQVQVAGERRAGEAGRLGGHRAAAPEHLGDVEHRRLLGVRRPGSGGKGRLSTNLPLTIWFTGTNPE